MTSSIISKLFVAVLFAAKALCFGGRSAICFLLIAPISMPISSSPVNSSHETAFARQIADGKLIEIENSEQFTQPCDRESDECVQFKSWNISVNAGLGLRTNPLHDGDNIPLIFIPSWYYYGEAFFIENLEMGYTFFENEVNQISLITSPSYDRVFFNRWDPSNFFIDIGITSDLQSPTNALDNLAEINSDELSSRRFSYLGGIEWSVQFDHAVLQASLLSDLTGVHDGSEIRLAYQHKLNDNFSTTLGLTWKDKKLTDYYYGVNADEIMDDRGAYQASASINPFFRMSYKMGEKPSGWRLSMEYQMLSNQISNSPLTNDNYVVTFFVGKQFSWN